MSHMHLSGSGGAHGVGDGDNQRLVGEQLHQLMSTYQHLQKPCTLVRPYPSPLLNRRGIPPVKPKHKHVISCY